MTECKVHEANNLRRTDSKTMQIGKELHIKQYKTIADKLGFNNLVSMSSVLNNSNDQNNNVLDESIIHHI